MQTLLITTYRALRRYTLLLAVCGVAVCSSACSGARIVELFRTYNATPEENMRLLQSRMARYVGKIDARSALRELNTFIEYDSTSAYAYGLRAAMHSAFRDTAQAIADYEKSLAIDPKNTARQVRYGILKAEYRYGYAKPKQDFAHAVQAFTMAIDNDSLNEDYWFYRGCVRAYLLEYPQAIADFTASAKLNQENAFEAQAARGICYLLQDSIAAALADFNGSLQQRPSYYALLYRASIDLRERRFANATKGLNDALQLNEQTSNAYQKPMFAMMDERAQWRMNQQQGQALYMLGAAELAEGNPASAWRSFSESYARGFSAAQEALATYYQGEPYYDSLQRFAPPEVDFVRKYEEYEDIIRDARKVLSRFSETNLYVASSLDVFSTALARLSPTQSVLPGSINALDCNRRSLLITVPQSMNTYCVVAVLLKDLRVLNDGNVNFMLGRLRTYTEHLFAAQYAIACESSGTDSGAGFSAEREGAMSAVRRDYLLLMRDEFNALNSYLERLAPSQMQTVNNRSGQFR